jgi:hypothetical protein
MKKHFIIKRNDPTALKYSLQELPESFKLKKNQVNEVDPLLLIEITSNESDGIEKYSNVWTVKEGCPILWEKYTKGRLMYDYTGIVNPIIHLNGKVYTWDEYNRMKNSEIYFKPFYHEIE